MTSRGREKVEGGATEVARPLILSMGGAKRNLSTAHEMYICSGALTCN